MTKYSQHFNPQQTSQLEKAHPSQVQNSAGGFSFALDIWGRLDRWLILGADGGTYYASERALTKENAQVIVDCLKADGKRTIDRIVEISKSGRAPKNDPAIFALALAASDENEANRKMALAALPEVCRIGTHLFQFAESVNAFRGWGRGLRNAIGNWYATKSPDAVAYQLVKYQQRNGWSHRDLLRLAHPQASNPQLNAAFRYVIGGKDMLGPIENVKTNRHFSYPQVAPGALPKILEAYEKMKAAKTSKEVCELIESHGMTHEMVMNEWKSDPAVWESLLQKMPLMAMIRNLGKITAVGTLAPLSKNVALVCKRLADREQLRAARVHPLAILSALRVYSQGHGEKGSLTWTPVPAIVSALDSAFYLAFEVIEPTGKNMLLALDVSSSMTWGTIAGVPGIDPRVGSAAMAMVTARTEKNWHVMGFSNHLVDIPINARMSLDDVVRKINAVPMGGTDCALPMIWAEKNKTPVDAFVVYTDSETWAGNIHPFQALKSYRQKMGIPAKLVVVGMQSNGFTIADPNDAGMLDLVGFDSSAPALMSDFISK